MIDMDYAPTSMAAVRQPAWHGIGAVLDQPPASIHDALVAAGLDWQVEKRPLYVEHAPAFISADGGHIGEADLQLDEKHHATVRTDTNAILGVVGAGYKTFQNHEAFDFLSDLLNEDHLRFETLGAFTDGAVVWCLVRTPEHIEVGGDAIQPYVFVATSHDGSLSLTAAQTPVRIVCRNTLAYAISGAQQVYRVRHTQAADARWDEARTVLGITVNYGAQFKRLGDQLAGARVTTDEFKTLLDDRIMPAKAAKTEKATENREQAVTLILDTFQGNGPDGDTQGNAPGTAWCAINAVAEYSDWFRKMTVRTDQLRRSVEDTRIKQRALNVIREYVGV